MEKIKLECWQKISLAFCGMIIMAAVLLLAPFVQNLVFYFVEKFVVRRSLTRIVWIERFAKYGIKMIFFFLFVSVVTIFWENIRKSKIFVPNFFLFLMSVLILMRSPLNPFANGNSYTDSSVFRYVAQVMQNGGVPYRDTFDHKGPLLFFINYWGTKISFEHGVWILEVAFLFFTMFATYRLARLFLSCYKALVPIAFVYMLMKFFFEGGNLTEEYALLFISLSIYIFTDYFLFGKISNLRLVLCGASFACVVLLRANMISVWLVFCPMVAIQCIRKKEFARILNFLVFFFLGMAAIFLPTLIYFWCHDAVKDFIECYFIFNMRYSANKNWKDRILSMKKFALTFHFIIACITILFCIRNSKTKENKFFNIGYSVFLFFSLFFTALSGRQYGHYYMAMLPTLIYPFSLFFKTTFKKDIFKFNIRGQTHSAKLCYCFAVALFIICGWYALYAGAIFSKCQDSDFEKIVPLIQEITNADEKIIVIGNRNIAYLKSRRLAASKYSYQMPIGVIEPKIMDEFFYEIENSLPKIALVDKGYNDLEFVEKVDCFLKNNNYEKIEEVKMYSIFMRKKLN